MEINRYGRGLESQNPQNDTISEPIRPQEYSQADKNHAQNAPEDESQLQWMNKPAGKQVPFALLLQVIEPQLDKDRAMQLQCLLKNNKINKEEFVRHVRRIAGDDMLKTALFKIQQGQFTTANVKQESDPFPQQSFTNDANTPRYYSSSYMNMASQSCKQETHDLQLECQNGSGGNSSLASGSNAKAQPEKPLEASVSSLSKKQKVAGAFSDQSIEQINVVTATSGVNLREEEEQLFSGSKEDGRVSEASRKVIQEEERLILQKAPPKMSLKDVLKLRSFDDMESISTKDKPFLEQVSHSIAEIRPVGVVASREKVIDPEPTLEENVIVNETGSASRSKRNHPEDAPSLNHVEYDSMFDNTADLRPPVHLETDLHNPDHWFETEALMSARSVDLPDEEKYVPDWRIVNKDVMTDADTAKMFVYNLSTPAEYLRHCRMGEAELSDRFFVNQAESVFLATELHRRWVEAEVERTRLLHQVETGKEIVTELDDLKIQLKDALGTVQMLQSSLKSEREAMGGKLKEQTDCLLKLQNECDAHKLGEEQARSLIAGLEQTKERVDREVEALRKEKRWLLTEGLEMVTRKTLKCAVTLEVIGAVQNAMNVCGYNAGVKAGYVYALDKKLPLESVPLDSNADESLNVAVARYDSLKPTFLSRLAVDMPIEDMRKQFQAA